jgi:hypothetical protein
MPVKTEKELSEAQRSHWLKAVAAIELRNFGYAISLLQGVLRQEPEFLTGRQLLRRAETAKFAAVLSQTPVHELVGELVNLSAEALAAAEIGRDRMVGERKTGQAEAYEQALAVAVGYGGRELPVDTEMIYRDTSARAFGAVVDGLGKLAQMLSVPAAELWEKIPGATRQDVERWKKAAAEAPDPMADVASMLDRQAGGTRRESGLILPPGVQA